MYQRKFKTFWKIIYCFVLCRWWQQNLDDCADCSSGEKPGRICVQFEFCATCSNRWTGSGKQTSGSNRRWGTLTETKLTNIESLSSFSMNCSWYKPGILPLASESFVGIQCKVIVVGMMHEVLLSYLKLFCDMSDHIICTLSFALCMRFIFTIFKHKSSLTYKNTFHRNLCSKFNILEVISLTLCLSFHLWKIKNFICW